MPLDNLTESDEDLAAHFLKYWGISALFHDIGYPFELSFEQVKSYFKNNINYVPFVMYNMNNYLVSEATYHIPKMEKELEEATTTGDIYLGTLFGLLRYNKQLDGFVSSISCRPLAVEMPRKKLLMICTKASRSDIPSGSISSRRVTMAEAV